MQSGDEVEDGESLAVAVSETLAVAADDNRRDHNDAGGRSRFELLKGSFLAGCEVQRINSSREFADVIAIQRSSIARPLHGIEVSLIRSQWPWRTAFYWKDRYPISVSLAYD